MTIKYGFFMVLVLALSPAQSYANRAKSTSHKSASPKLQKRIGSKKLSKVRAKSMAKLLHPKLKPEMRQASLRDAPGSSSLLRRLKALNRKTMQGLEPSKNTISLSGDVLMDSKGKLWKDSGRGHATPMELFHLPSRSRNLEETILTLSTAKKMPTSSAILFERGGSYFRNKTSFFLHQGAKFFSSNKKGRVVMEFLATQAGSSSTVPMIQLSEGVLVDDRGLLWETSKFGDTTVTPQNPVPYGSEVLNRRLKKNVKFLVGLIERKNAGEDIRMPIQQVRREVYEQVF